MLKSRDDLIYIYLTSPLYVFSLLFFLSLSLYLSSNFSIHHRRSPPCDLIHDISSPLTATTTISLGPTIRTCVLALAFSPETFLHSLSRSCDIIPSPRPPRNALPQRIPRPSSSFYTIHPFHLATFYSPSLFHYVIIINNDEG